MLLRNDLLQYDATDNAKQRRTVRILWIDPARTMAYMFDMDGKGCDVESARLAQLEADVAAGRARQLQDDPWLVVTDQQAVKPGHLALRDRAWAIVAELTAAEPAIYEARRRGQLIADYTARNGVSHPTIYRYLRRYWQRGQTPNALLPDYSNSGARGKTRASTAGVKRGRPRREGAPQGVNVDEPMRRIFRVAAATYTGTRFSRRGAYDSMLRDFFGTRSVAGDTWHVVRRNGADDAVPSFGQFSYWLDQGQFLRPFLRPAERPLPLPPHATVVPEGRPGAAFHVAAVRADVQLLAQDDRTLLAGRPVLYLVSDVFSGMVTGFHVGTEAPGAQQALMALAHCAADKTRYAGRHGRTIAAQDWPCRHLPELLLLPHTLAGADGDGAAGLLNNFGIRSAVGMTGDVPARAALERRFGLLRTDAPARSDTLGALDGALDLNQFTRLVIDAVIEHNLQGDGNGPAPLQLWDWGVRERGAALKQFGEELVRCALLPVQEALVTAEGICLNGTYYSCAKAVDERWFERARQRGRWVVRVACDTAEPGCIYLPDPAAPMRYHACHPVQQGGPALSPLGPFPRQEPARQRVPATPYASFERIVAGFVG